MCNKMGERGINNFSHFLTIMHVLAMVNCSRYIFQRIDKNANSIMVVGLTRNFHQCSIDSGCNFIVKGNEGSGFEKLQNIDHISNFYYVWKKLQERHGALCINALCFQECHIVSFTLCDFQLACTLSYPF